MIAREDTTVPRGHGVWIAGHVTGAVLLEVDGGHFGPRVQPEERLLSWVGGADIELARPQEALNPPVGDQPHPGHHRVEGKRDDRIDQREQDGRHDLQSCGWALERLDGMDMVGTSNIANEKPH
jgi:hypothetical protein